MATESDAIADVHGSGLGRGLGRDQGDGSVRTAVFPAKSHISADLPDSSTSAGYMSPFRARDADSQGHVGSHRAGEVGCSRSRSRRNRRERCLPRSLRHDHDSQRTLLHDSQRTLPARCHRRFHSLTSDSGPLGTAGGGSVHCCAIVEVHNRLDTRCCLRQHRSDALSYLRAVSHRLQSAAVCQRRVASQPSRARQLPWASTDS